VVSASALGGGTGSSASGPTTAHPARSKARRKDRICRMETRTAEKMICEYAGTSLVEVAC
jgi:hypothetical protein